MSGIAALYTDRFPVTALISAMHKRLAHRGGDLDGLWHDSQVALAQHTLSFDAAPEHFPVTDWTGDIRVIADARLDNRDELLAVMGLSSTQDAPLGDGALILAAYRKWGYDFPLHLLGDFAIIIWDAAARTLLCARDHLGIKPLFFTQKAGMFACASEINALLTLPMIARTPDDEMIADYLTSQIGVTRDPMRTFYADIKRVPAGSCVTGHLSAAQTRRYWSFEALPTLILRDDAEYAAAFREVFTSAVAARLRGVERLGLSAALSGGLDSSSVVSIARTLAQQPIITLHIGSDTPDADERAYADLVVQGGGVDHHEIAWVSPLHNIQTIISQQHSPTHIMNVGLTQNMMRVSSERGARIFLDGVDGDAIVGHGFARLTELAVAGDLAAFDVEVAALSRDFDTSVQAFVRQFARPLLSLYAERGQWLSFWRTAQRYRTHFGYSLPHMIWRWVVYPRLQRLRRRDRPSWRQLNPFIRAEFAAAVDLDRRLKAERKVTPLNVREEYAQALNLGVFSLVMPEYDLLAAHAGVVNWHPFCDLRLVEFCAALPGDQKLRDGMTRGVLRRAMTGYLPEEVRLRRSKTNFHTQFTALLFTEDRPLIERALASEAAADYLDMRELRAQLRQIEDEREVMDVNRLFRAVKLILWRELAES